MTKALFHMFAVVRCYVVNRWNRRPLTWSIPTSRTILIRINLVQVNHRRLVQPPLHHRQTRSSPRYRPWVRSHCFSRVHHRRNVRMWPRRPVAAIQAFPMASHRRIIIIIGVLICQVSVTHVRPTCDPCESRRVHRRRLDWLFMIFHWRNQRRSISAMAI